MLRAISSVGERFLHTEEVVGSIPTSPTSNKAGSKQQAVSSRHSSIEFFLSPASSLLPTFHGGG